jgi:hypothetical protein
MVDRELTELGQIDGRLITLALLAEISWGFGGEKRHHQDDTCETEVHDSRIDPLEGDMV